MAQRESTGTLDEKKHRILFVDDDQELREIVKGHLTEAGYNVDDAKDGFEAIDKLQRGNYDLLLLDITMPGKSGIDVLKFKHDQNLPCRVIMLTGMVGLSFAIKSVKLGADDYITKPYNMEYLLASISKVLAK
ncbi:MAG: response regulator [Ignavibacteriae bacterium]|nr:response regulator [Ignavibacteriota bacterium]